MNSKFHSYAGWVAIGFLGLPIPFLGWLSSACILSGGGMGCMDRVNALGANGAAVATAIVNRMLPRREEDEMHQSKHLAALTSRPDVSTENPKRQ